MATVAEAECCARPEARPATAGARTDRLAPTDGCDGNCSHSKGMLSTAAAAATSRHTAQSSDVTKKVVDASRTCEKLARLAKVRARVLFPESAARTTSNRNRLASCSHRFVISIASDTSACGVHGLMARRRQQPPSAHSRSCGRTACSVSSSAGHWPHALRLANGAVRIAYRTMLSQTIAGSYYCSTEV